jgi:hypothetical protein
MKNLYILTSDSPDRTENQEQDPQKMEEDNDIGKDFV